MTPELNNNNPEPIESTEPSNVPLMPPSSARKPTIKDVQSTHEMLVGFREGVKEGTFKGKHLVHIAMGLQFLDNMVSQSQQTFEMVRKQEAEMRKKAKEAIKEAGGKITEEAPIESGNNQPKA